MKNCIFCKIARGEIPCWKIYEDEKFLAFLDINPFVEGHTLVIPKKHYRWVWEVTELGEYFEVVRKIANHFQKVMTDEFVASLIWGLDVPHAHIHLLPKPYDLKLFALGERRKLTPEKASELVSKLRLNASPHMIHFHLWLKGKKFGRLLPSINNLKGMFP